MQKNAQGQGDYKSRFDESKKMMEYAFTNFSMKELYPKNYTIKKSKSLPVTKGKEKSVNIYSDKPVKVVIKNGDEKLYKPAFKVDKKKLNKEGQLTAPIKKNEVVGTLDLVYTGENDFGYLSKDFAPKINVVTQEKVEKANWFVLMMRGIGGFFSDMWTSVTKTVKGWF